MDSGLLMVSTVAPLASGFTAFTHVGGEGAVNKGFLWALLPPANPTRDEGGQLIVTTHMHAYTNPEARSAQRRQMIAEIARLRDQFEPALVLVCGDFNETADGHNEDGSSTGTAGLHHDMTAAPLRMHRLTDCKAEGTCLREDQVETAGTSELDHIYAAATPSPSGKQPTVVCERNPPIFTPWSDHALLWINRVRVVGSEAAVLW